MGDNIVGSLTDYGSSTIQPAHLSMCHILASRRLSLESRRYTNETCHNLSGLMALMQ
jgi:hypothetical protein